MKRTLLTLGLLFSLALPLSAQDATPCEIDLTSTVSLLVQAQGMAASGNTERALAQIELARIKLEAFEAACGPAPELPVTPVALELTQSRTIDDSDFDTTFQYPAGWSITDESGGVLLANAPEILNRSFDSAPPAFAPGEVALYMEVGDANTFGNGDAGTPSELLAELAAQVPASFGTQTEIVTFSVNDRPAALFTIAGANTDLMLMSASMGTVDGEPLFAQFILLAAPGELNAYEPTLQAIAESIDITSDSD